MALIVGLVIAFLVYVSSHAQYEKTLGGIAGRRKAIREALISGLVVAIISAIALAV